MDSNPVRHVVIALLLSLVTFVVAGDNWNASINRFQPVRPVGKAGA